jgi:hypothetical protein
MAFNLANARPAEEVESTPRFNLANAKPAGTPAEIHGISTKPHEPGLGERALRYMGEWGQGMRDAFAAPGDTPAMPGTEFATTAPLGIADAALSVASSVPATLLGLKETADARMAGDTTVQYPDRVAANSRAPKTNTGAAIIGGVGAVAKPIGDALTGVSNLIGRGAGALGASDQTQKDIADVIPDLAGTALDAWGVGMAAKGARFGAKTAADAATPQVSALGRARAGTNAIDPETAGRIPGDIRTAPIDPVPTSGAVGNPRPYGANVEQARRLDYRVMPSQVDAEAQKIAPLGKTNVSPPGTLRQTFAGPTLKDRFTIDNQKRTDRYAAKELGISEITEQGLELAKYKHNAVYNELTRVVPVIRRDAGLEQAADLLGEARRNNPYLRNTQEVERVRDLLLSADSAPTQKALDAIREYRKDARTAFQKVGDVEAEQAAYAYRAAADALEDAIERQAPPGMVERVRDARTALAKIHNVQDAYDGVHVDAQLLAKLGKKFPLSGYLGEIAQVATAFPDTMRSATGLTIKEPSNQSLLMSLNLAGRRALGREQIPTLMGDQFQSRYGAADPGYTPDGFGPRQWDSDPSVGPPVPPPTPTAGPSSLSGDMLDLAPEPTGDIPYTPVNPPPNPDAGLGLVEDAPPPFPAPNRPSGATALPGPLDENLGGLGIPAGGALPFSETPGAPPVVRTPPQDMRVAGTLSEGLDLVPDPVANPDVMPPTPDMNPGGLELQQPVAPGADVIDLDPNVIDPESIAALFDLVQQNGGLDFTQPDLQLGGRGRMLNPDRRNMPRAGGRGTTADDLSLAEGLDVTPREPLALPAPDLRATEGGMVGTPDQFDEMGLGTPGARAAAGREPIEGELLPPDAPGPQGERPISDELDLGLEDAPPREAALDLAEERGVRPDLAKLDVRPVEGTRMQKVENAPTNMLRDRALPPNSVVIFEGSADAPTRYIALEPSEGALTIRSVNTEKYRANTPRDQRTGPPGIELHVQAVKEAERRGSRLDMDSEVSQDEFDMLERAVESGVLEIPGWESTSLKLLDALDAGGGKARNPSGEPWFKGIRLGPAG